jgi:Cft2 family RNA processing exonuclease
VGVQIVLNCDNSLNWWRALPSSTQTRLFKWLLIAIHKFISNYLPFSTQFALDTLDCMALLLVIHQYCKDTRSVVTWLRQFRFTEDYNILKNKPIVWKVNDDAEPFDYTLVQALMEEFLVNVNCDLLDHIRLTIGISFQRGYITKNFNTNPTKDMCLVLLRDLYRAVVKG